MGCCHIKYVTVVRLPFVKNNTSEGFCHFLSVLFITWASQKFGVWCSILIRHRLGTHEFRLVILVQSGWFTLEHSKASRSLPPEENRNPLCRRCPQSHKCQIQENQAVCLGDSRQESHFSI